MSGKKKIIIVGPAYPLRGGIANFNESLANSLQKQNFETEIVSFTLQYPSLLFPGKNQKDYRSKPPYPLKITPKINSINPFSWFHTANYIIRQKPALVIFRYWIPFMAPCLGTIGRRLKAAGLQTVVITDNLIPHEHRPGDKILNRYFLNSFQKFVTLSKSVARDILKEKPSAQVVTSPHPIYDIFGEKVPKNEARKLLQLSENEKVILFFGFVRKYKGLHLLLEALAKEELKPLNLKLIVAGEFYDNKDEYLHLVNQLNIKNQVIFKDEFIPSEDVKKYFSAADIVVQPYLSATQSGVTQIAYHFETPMLVTNVGGLSEIVEHQKTGYVVQPDPKEIAFALKHFFENRRYEEISSHVKNKKHQFSWEHFTKQLLKLASGLQ
ncbi:MAG: glycosyltransferase [Bacteroidetes bacterium]|nr:MAG: glycosyltransferase [Bacteroidota bacterium]